MEDEDKYKRFSHIPIPTYDEATTSRPSSSQAFRGAEEVSDDAERQGLLPQESTYRPPTAESPRSSEDSDLRLPEVTGTGDDDRRRVEELDYLDPNDPDPAQRQSRLYHRARLRSKFSQHLSNLGATLSSIRLPSFRSLYTPVSASPDADASAETPPSRLTWLTRRTETLPTIPERYRMSAGTAARLCGLLSIALLIYALFILDVFPGNGRYPGTRFDPESVRSYVQDNVNAGRIEEYLTHITSYDHVAGTAGDLYMAEWMKERWIKDGNLDDIALMSYYVYLNYPETGGRSVSIVSPAEKKWVARLEEDVVDPGKEQSLAWHGNSKNGEVEGHLIYANGGSREDFKWLQDQGVVLNGSIALMRYHSTQPDRALKVKAAEEAGCVGALIYSDPKDDGGVGEERASWPDGPWRPQDSVQRGSVALSNWIVGDPLTPGHASTKDASRVSKENNPGLNQIPSLPLAWRDARVLIESLQNHGHTTPGPWVGGAPEFSDVWYTGDDSKDAPIVHLKNVNDESERQQIWNLHGLIEGLEQREKKIIVGSHRDAWCFGSVEPGSGSAVLMEMVEIFGQLRKLGWRPLRSIEFVSWDAEEYNLMGSTEYVEDNMDYLRDNAVAYLNVAAGVYGPDSVFRAAGSPMWQRALSHVVDRVAIPGDGATLRQIWEDKNSQLEGMGASGDYAGFQHMAGTSSIDFGFEGQPNAYPHGSCYETLEWMKKFGDPEFNWHRTLAQVWALLILEVADRPLLPFDLRNYAEAIKGRYLDSLQESAEQKSDKNTQLDLEPLRSAANHLTEVSEKFHRFEDVWTTQVLGSGGIENNNFAKRRLEYNNKLSNFERDLLDLPSNPLDLEIHGLPGREQFKHVILGPGGWEGGRYGVFFPLVRDAIERGNFTEAKAAVERTAATLRRATENLDG
ncbi:N-acetylated-alpha-linked acidic dipeptidase 2 [Lecanosticta acicola]|uniref:N-acetylated-alpha-linked acidic dipeptidase 2 n=1 Tax=Lecanosticta acicola TaxID=111012 RepID=A0AAI8YVB5_9PEZI|nr:N-acetylated-alpha-linked acidic dipeptidase 2 [Lecanosticta acicola]